MSVHTLNCNTGSGGACSSTTELPPRRPPPRCAFASSSSAPRAPSAVLLVRLLVVRNRGCRNHSSSSLARAPARASRASAASPTPPKSAPFAPRLLNQGTRTGSAISERRRLPRVHGTFQILLEEATRCS
ncbi:hypothetical protein EJB05_23198 [Eragrostis curvula]|uniref:Uncharacterized protein n=1 Tax=Eragrostis curvula TaxID=38414 RepID=A0A5J9V7T2_9POAL|nr:hypothetical protein EJB05_23198 [Eragrostis curvula]